MSSTKRTKQRIMSKSEFQSRRDKFRDVSQKVESSMEGSDSDQRFAVTLEEGSSFAAVDAKEIDTKEDLMKAMRESK